jgi:hypothetical protein
MNRDQDLLSPGGDQEEDQGPAGSGWEPDEYLSPYAAESFEVEKHATQILQAGNINEEVLYFSR